MRTDVPSATKWCHRCGERKEVAEFSRSARTKDGLSVWCRRCSAEYQRWYRRQYRATPVEERRPNTVRRGHLQARVDATDDLRWCARGQHLVARSDFYRNTRLASGLTVYCKSCTREYQRERYEARTSALPLRRWTVRHVDGAYFDALNTDEQAYVLGLYAADGWVLESRTLVGLELASEDEALIEFVREQLAPGARIGRRQRLRFVGEHECRVHSSATLRLTSPGLVAGLKRHGVTSRKSLTLQWPDHLPDAMLRPFLLGYFDGDGCATWSRGGTRARERCWVLLGTEAFLQGAVDFIERGTGIRLAPPYRMGSRNVYRITRGGQGARIIDAWLHEGHTLGLARKRI